MTTYQSHPSWPTDRRHLIDEVYGDLQSSTNSPTVRGNKVHSREMLAYKLANSNKRDHQLFFDFCLACEGISTTNFFADQNGQTFVPRESKSTSIMPQIAEFLTTLNTLRSTVEACRVRIDLGRCFFMLVDEISQFLTVEFPADITRIREEGGNSETTLSRIIANYAQPIKDLEVFVTNALISGFVGGRLLNEIKRAQPSFEITAPAFSKVMRRAHERGMKFYLQILNDWLNNVDLTEDRYFEFFIWDLARKRFSHAIGQQAVSLLATDELVYLTSVLPNYCNEICVRSFQRRFLVVPELCPEEISNSMADIVNTGVFKHVLKTEDKVNGIESSSTELRVLEQCEHAAMFCRRSRRVNGKLVISYFNTKPEFLVLMQKLPNFFCGLSNLILDNFVRTTEEFDWSSLPERENAKIQKLNEFFRKAVMTSSLANNQLDGLICVEFPSLSSSNSGLPITANCPDNERPLTDLVLTVKCDDLFVLAFPLNVFKIYRDLFRLRHTLKRIQFLLQKKRTFGNRVMSRNETMAINQLIRLVRNYDNFVFCYKMANAVNEFLNVTTKRISEKSMDVDEFAKLQTQMVTQIAQSAFLSSASAGFMKHMWQLLSAILLYASNNDDNSINGKQNTKLMKILRRIHAIKQRFNDENYHDTPELIKFLFGSNLNNETVKTQSIVGENETLQLCAAFKTHISRLTSFFLLCTNKDKRDHTRLLSIMS
ncbi:hypothetical protein M3Y94_00124600 [Aphelenchoides besseyi]|nr:hypothetical protein M3Y94_00124600 [Aphelenchoides besseyi]